MESSDETVSVEWSALSLGGRGNPPFGFVIRNCERRTSGLQRRVSALRVRNCGVRNSALDYEPGR